MQKFLALLLEQEEEQTKATVQSVEKSMEGQVVVKVSYSDINYKDALAVTGTGKIIRDFPFVAGIDYVGEVIETEDNAYQVGDRVVLTGWGVGERVWGGYAERAQAKSEWLVPLPKKLSEQQSMIIGTAGFTAGMCVQAIVAAGVKPSDGDVVVTGASGGVGSFAVALLAGMGYSVYAVSRQSSSEYLSSLGAKEVISRETMSEACRPLEKQRWVAAVDTVGGSVLSRVLAESNYGGVVSACGLVGGVKLLTTVMPFILRGVRLQGIDSVMCPQVKRRETWDFIADHITPEALSLIHSQEVDLHGIEAVCRSMLSGDVQGRVTVKL